MLCRVLKSTGDRLEEAADGQEAVDKVTGDKRRCLLDHAPSLTAHTLCVVCNYVCYFVGSRGVQQH